MSIIFDFIYIVLALFYMPALIFKGKRRIGLRQRLGAYPKDVQSRLITGDDFIWVHAVSVGEIKAAAPLIEQLRKSFPKMLFVISTITSTGNKVAKQIAAKKDIVIYLPFDLSFIVKKVISLINPKILLIMETEIWPNMICIAAKRKIPIIIANGRISDKAYPKYKMFSFVFSPIIKKIDLFCMQSDKDAKRVIALGAKPQLVKVTGNIKFDQVKEQTEKTLPELKAEKNELLITAGSTHDNEEEIITRVFIRLKQTHSNIRLLIAPRHPERCVEVVRMLDKYDLQGKLLSKMVQEGQKIASDNVLVLDIIGVLNQVYILSDIVFVGGSLIKHGGQNPIEPAFCRKPIIFGKYMFNFHEIKDLFLSNNAAVSVNNEEELMHCLDELIKDEGKRKSLAANAKALVEKNQGAVKRIESLLMKNNLLKA